MSYDSVNASWKSTIFAPRDLRRHILPEPAAYRLLRPPGFLIGKAMDAMQPNHAQAAPLNPLITLFLTITGLAAAGLTILTHLFQSIWKLLAHQVKPHIIKMMLAIS